MIRFIYHHNYPKDVEKENGEKWFLSEHVPAVKNLPGILRYRSWPYIDVGIPYPSAGAPTPHNQFLRRTEICFAARDEGIKTILANQQLWKGAEKPEPGFRQIECMLLEEEAEFNLLRDVPYQQYKYMSLPLSWPKGRPEVDEDEELFINSYSLLYAGDIAWSQGEDWYLGHHTREGKQLSGMRHYKTWRVVRIPGLPDDSILKLNKWARLTELGMSPAAYKLTMVDEETRVRFTPSPLSPAKGVLGGWLNISIKLDQFDDFLKQEE